MPSWVVLRINFWTSNLQIPEGINNILHILFSWQSNRTIFIKNLLSLTEQYKYCKQINHDSQNINVTLKSGQCPTDVNGKISTEFMSNPRPTFCNLLRQQRLLHLGGSSLKPETLGLEWQRPNWQSLLVNHVYYSSLLPVSLRHQISENLISCSPVMGRVKMTLW